MIDFVLESIESIYQAEEVHIIDSNSINKSESADDFIIEFSTAFLANIFHSKICQEWLRNNENECIKMCNKLLNMLNYKHLKPLVLMHILICLSYFNKT